MFFGEIPVCHGDRKAPIFVGGGVAFGPKPRDYTQKMPRKMRRAALRSALSVKASDEDILVLDEISLSEPKTREMAQVKDKLAGDSSALLIVPEKNENYDVIQRAANNLPDLKLLMANYMNIRDLLGYDKVIIPLAALDIIESYLG